MSDFELTRLFLRLGLSLSAAVVLEVLLRSKTPLSFREIVERTGYAKGHVSFVLKQLELKNLVERVYEGRKMKFKLRENAVSSLILEQLTEIKRHLEPIASDSSICSRDRKLPKILEGLSKISSGDLNAQ